MAVPRFRQGPMDGTQVVGSGQASPGHTGAQAYRCFLPDLTGFTGADCPGPDSQHHLPEPAPQHHCLNAGIQSCYSGLQVQGTATSPSSTANQKTKWRRERDSNPRDGLTPSTRFPGERLRPTQPSLRECGICFVAERVRFELTGRCLPPTRFRGEGFKPDSAISPHIS